MYWRAENRRDTLIPFLALSLALHLVFLVILPLLPSSLPVPEFLKKKAEEEEKRPIYVKILDMPRPKKEEVPPKNAHIISQYNTRKKGPKGKQRPSFMSGSAPVLTPKPGPPLDIPGSPGHPGSKPFVAQTPLIAPPRMERPQKSQKAQKGQKTKKGATARLSKPEKKAEKGKTTKKATEEAAKEKAKESQEKLAQKREKEAKKRKEEKEKREKKTPEPQVTVEREPSPPVEATPSHPPVPKRKIPLFDPALINEYAKHLNPQMDTGESVTIELDTKKSKYISYFRHIREKLYLVWRYPTEARMAGIQGSLRLLFVIDRSGHLTEVKLLRSSGYTILDNEAMRAIRAAAPFGPFPSDWREKELRIKARFSYHLYQEGFQ